MKFPNTSNLCDVSPPSLSRSQHLFSVLTARAKKTSLEMFSLSLSLSLCFFFFSPLSSAASCADAPPLRCRDWLLPFSQLPQKTQTHRAISWACECSGSYSKVNICFWHLDSSLNAHVAPARIVRNVHGENRKLKVSGSTQTWERDDVSQPQQRVKYGQWVPTTVSGRVMSKCVHRWVRTSKETHITLRIRLVFFTH